MSLKLPPFELFEEGSQIRRSCKRVPASIVEGHTQRKHKGQYLSYLYRALASADETQEHLKILHGTGSLSDTDCFKSLLMAYSDLSAKLFRFIQAIESRFETPSYLKGLLQPHIELDPEDATPPDAL